MGREPDGHTSSIELCGGTHCARTGDIALFKIMSESAVAAGIRRIEALTGEAAYRHVRDEERLLGEAAEALKVTRQDLPARVVSLMTERRRLEQELSQTRQKLVLLQGTLEAHSNLSGSFTIENPQNRRVGDILFAPRRLEGVPAKELRATADAIGRQIESGVVAVVSVSEGKAALVVKVSDDLKGSVSAVELVKAGVAELGGKGGGGRPDFAQGGGPDGARAEAALAAIERGLASHAAAAE
jgi:alanyl-tRNA synthetase